MKRILLRKDRDVLFATATLTLATALAFAPDAYMPMLARAFLMEWVAVFALLLVWSAWRRWAWTGGASALACVMVLVQIDAPVMEAQAVSGVPTLRVAQMNLLQPNRHHADVVRLALESDADVLSFQEVSEEWASVLATELTEAYPYHRVQPNDRCYGIALFSRLPIDRVEVVDLEHDPVIEARVRTGKGSLRLFSVHANSPGTWWDLRRRNSQLRLLAELVRAEDLPTVVVGDLNTVSWDHAMWRFCARSGLRVGTEPTSPTFPSVLGMALIPIDHVLVSPGTSIVHSRTFTIPGSDHRGLIADIAT